MFNRIHLAAPLFTACALAMTIHSEGRAQSYHVESFGSYSYRAPYINGYHGYWRDQGYGRRPYQYGIRAPYRNDYHGYWRDQGYGFTRQPVYHGYYFYESHGFVGPGIHQGPGRYRR